MSTPLERGSTVIYCAVCINAGRATEATHQTRDTGLCGCDQHIQQLEQHGLAALRRQRGAPTMTPAELRAAQDAAVDRAAGRRLTPTPGGVSARAAAAHTDAENALACGDIDGAIGAGMLAAALADASMCEPEDGDR